MRITEENSPRNGDAEDNSDSDSDDGSEAPDSPRYPLAGDNADAPMGEGTDRLPLSVDARRTIAAIIVRLASRAQYSKVNTAKSTPQTLIM